MHNNRLKCSVLILLLSLATNIYADIRPATATEIAEFKGIVKNERAVTTARVTSTTRAVRTPPQRSFFERLSDSLPNYSDYLQLIDRCDAFQSGNDPVRPRRGRNILRKCRDATYTYDQPDNQEVLEGRCGQTAISNTVAILCQRAIDPRVVASFTHDITPGLRPSTVKVALNQVMKESSGQGCATGRWRTESFFTAYQYIEGVKRALYADPQAARMSGGKVARFTPALTLVGLRLKLHWITVVAVKPNRQDSYGCDVITNTWGRQYKISCENFARLGNTAVGYNLVLFEP